MAEAVYQGGSEGASSPEEAILEGWFSSVTEKVVVPRSPNGPLQPKAPTTPQPSPPSSPPRNRKRRRNQGVEANVKQTTKNNAPTPQSSTVSAHKPRKPRNLKSLHDVLWKICEEVKLHITLWYIHCAFPASSKLMLLPTESPYTTILSQRWSNCSDAYEALADWLQDLKEYVLQKKPEWRQVREIIGRIEKAFESLEQHYVHTKKGKNDLYNLIGVPPKCKLKSARYQEYKRYFQCKLVEVDYLYLALQRAIGEVASEGDPHRLKCDRVIFWLSHPGLLLTEPILLPYRKTSIKSYHLHEFLTHGPEFVILSTI
eukprot:TRINITY_DN1835_c0_g1_i4.p1 TRINITY_DN1835_c0_g1~~TRINITY_DN1835_c0_g1_i4.p1  ORF type:complete len:315 (-),score=51.47 TRINITY_DN1835_c0_g1_i4:679-1623(-)